MNCNLDIYTRLASIGINISTNNALYPFTDIEKTILLSANEIPREKRFLGLLLSWIKNHGEHINIERLKKLNRGETPWLSLLAFYAVSCGQKRWNILALKASKKYAIGDFDLAEARINIKGQEEWAENTGFLISKGSISINDKFVINPFQLAKVNLHYRNKLIYGANWRADIITAIQAGASNAFQASKISSASYEPAHRTFQDLKIAGTLDLLLHQR